MKRFLNVFLCFGLVVVFCGCGGSDAPTASDTSAPASVAVAPASSKTAASVEIVYFGSPG